VVGRPAQRLGGARVERGQRHGALGRLAGLVVAAQLDQRQRAHAPEVGVAPGRAPREAQVGRLERLRRARLEQEHLGAAGQHRGVVRVAAHPVERRARGRQVAAEALDLRQPHPQQPVVGRGPRLSAQLRRHAVGVLLGQAALHLDVGAALARPEPGRRQQGEQRGRRRGGTRAGPRVGTRGPHRVETTRRPRVASGSPWR
jgi:hypothetical protein